MTQPAKSLCALEALLIQEQEILRSGKITQLSDLDSQKSDLMMALSDAKLEEPDTILRLRKIAERNHELMEAAHAGVKAAKDRFEALIAAQRPMNLYGPKGQRSQMSTMTKSSIEKRT